MIGFLRAVQPILITTIVTISSFRVVEAVRKRASSILSSDSSIENGIARVASLASTGRLDLGAFSKSIRRKISPFSFGFKAVPPSVSSRGGFPN